MSEELNNEIGEGEVEKVADKVRVKRRELVIHLPWYKTQWGAGLILGLELGLIAGIPIAFIVYQLAVVVVRFISAS